MEDKEKTSIGYRLGEALGTVIIGSIIVLVIGITAKILTRIF